MITGTPESNISVMKNCYLNMYDCIAYAIYYLLHILLSENLKPQYTHFKYTNLIVPKFNHIYINEHQ